jgi:hypothetical protein
MLKTLIAASAVTLITAMSGPSAPWPPPSIIEQPPAKYDHAPIEPFVVLVGSPAQVHYACGGAPLPTDTIYLACTFMPRRVILMPYCPPSADEYCGRLMRHEMAHLNGWRH